jgi:snapalysin
VHEGDVELAGGDHPQQRVGGHVHVTPPPPEGGGFSLCRLLVEGSGADFAYYEGNDSRGSYASTDGHGRGYIFLDYRQNQQYNSTRVTAHETGHVLGLPDHCSGPCSELMSGGGPGTSCQNAYPNSQERSRVNQLWANGLAAAIAKVS